MALSNPIMPFLRPLCLPRPSTFRSLFRFSTSTRYRIEAPAVATTKVPIPPSALSKPPTSPPATQLPYHVSRTPSSQHPVYHLAKRGGNLHQTRIKKVNGDIHAFVKDLREYLDSAIAAEPIDMSTTRMTATGPKARKPEPPKPVDIKVNWLTRHVIVKGWHKEKVHAFLTSKGF